MFSTITGKLITDINGQNILDYYKSQSAQITSFEISPNGSLIAAGYSDDFDENHPGSYTAIWDIQSKSMIHTLSDNNYSIGSISFSPDNLTIASGSIDHSIIVWDLKTGKQLNKITTIKSAITSIQYSPDGKTLAAAGSADSSIYLFQVSDKVLRGHNGKIQCITFSPDGKYLASHGTGRKTEIWDIQNEKIIQTILDDRADNEHGSADIAFSADGQIIAIAATRDLYSNMKITFWKVSDGSYITTILRPIFYGTEIKFTKDGSMFASATNKLGGGIGIYKIRNNTNNNQLFQGENVFIDAAVHFTSDNKSAYVANKEGLSIYDATTGKLQEFLELPYWIEFGQENNCKLKFACTMEISSDGSRILLRTGEKEAVVYDNKGGQIFAQTFKDVDTYRYDVHLSPDGNYLSIKKLSSNPEEFQIIDIKTKQIILTLNKGAELIKGIDPQFSPDGKYIMTTVSGKQPHTYLWNTSDGSLIKHYTDVGSYIFSRDSSKIILVNGSKIVIRSLPDNVIIKTISLGDLLYPQIVALSQNETYIALYKDRGFFGIEEGKGALHIYNLDTGIGDIYSDSISSDKATRVILDNYGSFRIFTPADNN